MSIYRTAVKNPVTTALVFIAFAIFGIFSFMNTSIAQYPDVDASVVMVMCSYPGASASDVEVNLTKPLENSLNGVEHLKDMTSKSRENFSMVVLEFRYGTDIDEAMNNVRDKLDIASQNLPDGASSPMLLKFSMDDMPIMIMTASAKASLPGLEKILDDKLTTPLGRVDGVGTVTVTGAPEREIQVYCDPAKLQAYGLSVGSIAQVIATENKNIPSGNIDVGTETFTLRVEKEFKDPSEMLDIVVGSSNGQIVYLRDVATVYDGPEEKSQEAYTSRGGDDYIGDIRTAMVMVTKQTGSNTVDVIKSVKEKLVNIKESLPTDVNVDIIIDGSTSIINTINSLKETIIITLLVVMLVVFVFLGRWRATFIVVISIPIALLGSLVYLLATGNTLNIISMASLSIAIGMVVDDAIVVLENVSTHLERGEKPHEAAIHGTGEVGISVIASTLTMFCVFLPLTMVSGMAGIMFKQLGFIVTIIMTISTTAALTLVPMMCSRLLNNKPKNGRLHRLIFDPIEWFLDRISAGYAKIVGWAVVHRKSVVFIAFAIFFVVLFIFGPGLKTEYFPNADQERLSVTITLPVGTEQTVSGEFIKNFAERLRGEVPEIKFLNYSFGQNTSDNALSNIRDNGSNIISMNINVGSPSTRTRRCSAIADIIRKDLDEYPEVHKAVITEGMGGMGGASTIKVEVYGYDFFESDRIANELKTKMKADDCFTEVTLSRDEYTPEYQMDFDRTKLALHGLNSVTAAQAFSAAMSGSVASIYREEGEEYNIRVRYAKQFRGSVEDIENIIVYNPQGQAIRMKELGKVIETQVPPTIERKNRERCIIATGVVKTGYALSDAVTAARAAISDTAIPSNMSVEVTGDFEDQQEMFGSLIILMILMLILVYMVMASQFESFMSPFVIMFSVPFALTGVILGLSATQTPLGVMAMIGIIILIGIVVKNGIVLIDYTILLRERGKSVIEASVMAARSRLRPILMTTLTTVLGMVPMAIGKGEGAETWRSLGMTVCWGLTISTLVTLVLIPTVYCIFAARQEKNQAKKKAAAQQN